MVINEYYILIIMLISAQCLVYMYTRDIDIRADIINNIFYQTLMEA